MSRLLGDLLDVSSIETGHLAMHLRCCDVSAIVDDALVMVQTAATQKHLQLELDPRSGRVVACRDHDRILQVLGNLFGNAIKFTAEGGRIRVRVRRDDPFVEVSVSDTGRGIPAEEQPIIFDRFWKTKESQAGTGLGLFICKGIVESHGGRIWVESAPGVGSTFRFTIPLPGSPNPG